MRSLTEMFLCLCARDCEGVARARSHIYILTMPILVCAHKHARTPHRQHSWMRRVRRRTMLKLALTPPGTHAHR